MLETDAFSGIKQLALFSWNNYMYLYMVIVSEVELDFGGFWKMECSLWQFRSIWKKKKNKNILTNVKIIA